MEHWTWRVSMLSFPLLSIISSFLSTRSFPRTYHYTLAWVTLQTSKQATKHTSSLIFTLSSMTMHSSVPYHCQISCVILLGCLYCLIHSSSLNYDLASNTNYHTTETAFQVYVAKSNSHHLIYQAALIKKPWTNHWIFETNFSSTNEGEKTVLNNLQTWIQI